MFFQSLNAQRLDLFGAGDVVEWIAFPLGFEEFVREVVHLIGQSIYYYG